MLYALHMIDKPGEKGSEKGVRSHNTTFKLAVDCSNSLASSDTIMLM